MSKAPALQHAQRLKVKRRAGSGLLLVEYKLQPKGHHNMVIHREARVEVVGMNDSEICARALEVLAVIVAVVELICWCIAALSECDSI